MIYNPLIYSSDSFTRQTYTLTIQVVTNTTPLTKKEHIVVKKKRAKEASPVKASARMKAGITSRALLQRINRRLAPQKETVKVWRTDGTSQREVWLAGDYYHIDCRTSLLLDCNVDLEALGAN